MKIDPTKVYLMPLIMGATLEREKLPGMVYKETESLVLQYLTDPDAIPPLLPDCFQPGANPLVSVSFMCSNGVDRSDGRYYLAGGGYRLASVSIAARYDGEQDHLNGDYILVMFENDTWPIIGGRENLGIHKLYADISSIKIMPNKYLRCDVSLWGHHLYGIEIEPPEKQNEDTCKAAGERATNWPRFGYKYITSFDAPPDADYPTVLWCDIVTNQLWIGEKGELSFGNPDEKDIGFCRPVLDALKSLPVRAVTQTIHSRGSQTIRMDKCGRLR